MAVVVSSNIVRMAFYLVVSLGAVAGLFFLAGADFLGAMQLMVYVGGTLVLLVFGVMLTARGRWSPCGPAAAVDPGRAGRRLAAGRAAATPSWSVKHWAGARQPAQPAQFEASPPTATPLGMGLVGRPHRPACDRPPPTRRERGMSGYLLVFEIISVHLLVVLVGAAYLARAKRGRQENARRRTDAGQAHAATQRRSLTTELLTLTTTMNLLTQPVGLSHYLVVGAVLFVCGVVCMAIKRNAIGVLMGIELVLNGANLNFVAFGSPLLRPTAQSRLGLDGQLIALFVIVLAAAEAAVALAIALYYYNNHATIDVDRATS